MQVSSESSVRRNLLWKNVSLPTMAISPLSCALLAKKLKKLEKYHEILKAQHVKLQKQYKDLEDQASLHSSPGAELASDNLISCLQHVTGSLYNSQRFRSPQSSSFFNPRS